MCSNDGVPLLRGSVWIAAAYLVGGIVLYQLGLSRLLVDSAAVEVPGRSWWRVGLLAAACAAITLRRTRPVTGLAIGTAAVAADAMIGASLPVWLAYGDLLYAAVLYGGPRVRPVVTRGGTLVVAAAATTVGVLTGEVAAAVLAAGLGALLLLTPVWWAGSLRDHRDLAEAARGRADALARVAALDRQSAVDEERRRLARDLHDVVAGHLAAIALHSAAGERLRTRDPAGAAEALTAIRADSVAALAQMQAMIDLLRGDADETALPGRLTDLSALVDSARAAGTPVEVTGAQPPVTEDLTAQTSMTGYRIVAEMLANAVRHAPGAPVRLTMTGDGETVTITATNPVSAPAAPPAAGGRVGAGLGNIVARARAIGGDAGIGRAPGRWTVWARLPVTGERA